MDMHDLQQISKECIRELEKANIPIRDEKIVEIKSEMLDENYGLCEYDGSYNFDIVIDERLLRDECPLKELKEVVIHELIHTCPRCLSHSNTWRKYARIMNDVYGYALLDCKDDDSIFHPEMPILHRFRCPKCGSIYNSRMPEEWDQQCEFCYSWMEKV